MTVETMKFAVEMQCEIDKNIRFVGVIEEIMANKQGNIDLRINNISREEKNFICTYIKAKREEEIKQLQGEFEKL